jgi:tetratricopeptide (TPR) repeat protein
LRSLLACDTVELQRTSFFSRRPAGGALAEDTEIEPPQAEPTTTADVALATALDEARGDDSLREDVRTFFRAQTEFVREQRHHLAAQFAVDLGLKGLDRWSRRLRLLLQGMTICVGALALGAVGWMAWQAHEDHSLVIPPISAPPGFAERGLTGPALAAILQNRLTVLQSETRNYDQGVRVTGSDADMIRLEVPESGVSLDEVQKLLRSWLSRETAVTAVITRRDQGLALTMRVGEEAAPDIVLPNDDVDALMQKAAERVYEVQSPVRYGSWLDQHGRSDEAVGVYRASAASGAAAKRGDALARLADFATTPEEAMGLLRQSEALNPNISFSALNQALGDLGLGLRETALQHFNRAYVIERARGRAGLASPNGITSVTYPLTNHGDYAGALDLRCADYHVSPCATEALATAVLTTRPDSYAIDRRAELRPMAIAGFIAGAHDTRAAQRVLDRYHPDLSARSALFVRGFELRQLAVQAMIDRERQDWTSAVAHLQQAAGVGSRWQLVWEFGSEDMTPDAELPDALAHAGRLAEAETLIAPTPADCYSCLVVRAGVAEMKGDRAGADRWMAEALRQGPSLPLAEQKWGEMLLARGRPDEAIARLTAAARKGPRSADVLETWGEALLVKGDATGAAAKFAEAARSADRWGRLHLKWAEALLKAGNPGEAQAQKRTAAALDLTAAERAELDGLRI